MTFVGSVPIRKLVPMRENVRRIIVGDSFFRWEVEKYLSFEAANLRWLYNTNNSAKEAIAMGEKDHPKKCAHSGLLFFGIYT